MLISDTNKFAFFHFPKTAGSAITAALAPILRNPKSVVIGPKWQMRHHVDKYQHHPVSDCGVPHGYFKASFVRNPFEIVVSTWDQKTSFEEFVITKVLPRQVTAAKWSQYEYLTYNGHLEVDFVGRYENLQKDFDKFCFLVRVPKKQIKMINESKGKDHYREYYNPKTRGIVASMYADDLRYFGYTY